MKRALTLHDNVQIVLDLPIRREYGDVHRIAFGLVRGACANLPLRPRLDVLFRIAVILDEAPREHLDRLNLLGASLHRLPADVVLDVPALDGTVGCHLFQSRGCGLPAPLGPGLGKHLGQGIVRHGAV